MTTETPRLDTIAPELLQTILSFISGPDTSGGGTVDVQISRVRSLHALTMASKQLRYETLPFLYRRFESWNDISLPLFARSLCENHELAKCLQFFYVSVSETQIQRPTEGTSYVSSYPTHELSFLTALSELDVDDNFLLEGGNWDSLKLPPHLRVLAVYMETPFIGFFQVFRAIGQTAQRDLSDVTITIPFGGNESHTDPFVGVWEVAGTDEPGKHVMTVQIDMNKEGSPWFYHLWTEDVSYSMRMRFLGEGMGQLMDFCAEQVVIHGVDFLINTKDYLPHSQSSHTAG
ncbi:hypothetical protein NU195Hw_Modified_48t1 [Hortaea werneckii]